MHNMIRIRSLLRYILVINEKLHYIFIIYVRYAKKNR